MVLSYSGFFQAPVNDDSEGFTSEGDDDLSEEKSSSQASLFDELSTPPKITLHDILESLITTAIKIPLSRSQVEHSLVKISQKLDLSEIFSALFKIFDSGIPGLRRSHRLVIYEIISSSLLLSDNTKQSNADKLVSLSPTSVKTFVIRLITDVNRSNCESITQAAIERFSKLIAILSISSFDDLVLRVLMSPDFVSGKPTVATTIVQDALVEIFAKFLDKDKILEYISEVLGKVETVSVLRMNNEIINAIATGVHRTGIALPPECLPSISVVYTSITETMSSESIQTALFLLSLLPRASSILHRTELEESILLIGAKGLENEDFRSDFLQHVSLIWQHRLALFDSHTEEFLSLALAIGDPDVWALGPKATLVPFLCRSRRPTASVLHALASVARSLELKTPVEEIVRYAESLVMISSSSSLEALSTADEVVGLLSVITALHESLVSILLVSFAEKFVCNPSPPLHRSLEGADLVKVRSAAQSALLTIASKAKNLKSQNLLTHFIECLEHMPTVGISTVCQAVVMLLGTQEMAQQIAQSQGFLVLIWLLISITAKKRRPGNEPVEPIIECLVSISGLIHPSLDGIYSASSAMRLADGSEIGDEFAFIIGAIEFKSREERDVFFFNGLETIVVLLSSGNQRDDNQASLISIWGELMRFVLPDQPVGVFSNRILELLHLHEAITASEECIRSTAKAIGNLADRRLDVVLEILTKTVKQAESVLVANGAGNAISSVSNSVRKNLNRSSFRGLFVFEKTEKIISLQISLRQCAILSLGFAIAACPVNRLSEIRVKECISDFILAELRADIHTLTKPPGLEKKSTTNIDFATSLAAVESICLVAKSLSQPDLSCCVDTEFFKKFKSDSLSLLLALSEWDSDIEHIFAAVTALIEIPSLSLNPITQEEFTAVLSSTLHALVLSVPDNPAALNTASPEAFRLASRCRASACVVRALFGHAASWTGFSRLIKAVFGLGANGPLPLVRWICLQIACVISQETDVVKSEQDTEEFAETVASILPRISDSYAPVGEMAKSVVSELFLRCGFTKDNNTAPLSILQSLPPKNVSKFLLHLIPAVHDADSAAAESVVDIVFNLLSLRASVFASPDSAADQVVDAILSNASTSPLPYACRVRLVTSLKFIAAVRFPIAIKEVLDSSNLNADKVHAIHSFSRDKTTVVYLTQDLLNRMVQGDERSLEAAVALGHMLDCYQDTGVCAITRKYFPEIFSSLLFVLWDSSPKNESVKLVIHKLCRAAKVASLPDSSLSAENGVSLLLDQNENFRCQIAEFIKPYIPQRPAAVTIASQVMGSVQIDASMLPVMVRILESNNKDNDVIRSALRGIGNAMKNKYENYDVKKSILLLATTLIASSDPLVALEALKLVHAIACPQTVQILMTMTLGILRRVVDHTDDQIRSHSFHVISSICAIVSENDALNPNGPLSDSIAPFFSAISDLWIPCLVRTQEHTETVSKQALLAFISILNAAIADQPVPFPANHDLAHLLSLVKSEICECSHVHLNSCSYYLLGLPSVSEPVMLAAAKLIPVLIELIPEPSSQISTILGDLVEKLLTLSSFAHEIDPVLADVVVKLKRFDTSH